MGAQCRGMAETVEPECHLCGGESSIYTAVEWKETDGTAAKGRSGEKGRKAGPQFMTVPHRDGGLFYYIEKSYGFSV